MKSWYKMFPSRVKTRKNVPQPTHQTRSNQQQSSIDDTLGIRPDSPRPEWHATNSTKHGGNNAVNEKTREKVSGWGWGREGDFVSDLLKVSSIMALKHIEIQICQQGILFLFLSVAWAKPQQSHECPQKWSRQMKLIKAQRRRRKRRSEVPFLYASSWTE